MIANSFGSSYQEQIVEIISKQLLTNPLRSWYEKSISHQKTTGISPPENVALKIVSIQLKRIPPKLDLIFPLNKLLPNMSLNNVYLKFHYAYIF